MCLRLYISRNGDIGREDFGVPRAVESVPGKVSGAWVFKGSPTPVSVVFENPEDGMTIDEVVEQFPVSREEIKAVLEFAVRHLDDRAAGRSRQSIPAIAHAKSRNT